MCIRDRDKIAAKVEHGVLTIDIPKKEILPETKGTKKIEVK